MRFSFRLTTGIVTLALAVAGLASTPVVAASAPAVPPAPALADPVVDTSGKLSGQQVGELAQQIAEQRTTKDYQIGILVVSTLDGYPIEQYSLDVARSWGIGEKSKDNGILVLVAVDDRQARIEVGRGLEGDITDAQAGRIIDQVMAPEFRDGDYYTGLSRAAESIAALVQGQPDPNASDDSDLSWFEVIVMIFIFGLPIAMMVYSLKHGGKSGGGSGWGGFGGFGGFSGGSSGGGSFGGGGFSGGGASGRW